VEGIGILKAISIVNISNDEIIDQAGNIIWKIISLNDFIDQEQAKLFADAHGHEAIIEIILSKQKGSGVSPFIRILNGLVQVPQLVQKLLDSGLVETVKLVNDIYIDDQNIITLNFDTMKKISNLKMGREILIKKNLIPNLIKNIKICAALKDPKAVMSGFGIVDNISRSDVGKDQLKSGKAIESISEILDYFEDDDQVLKLGAKIYSKISKPEDMVKEVEKLESIHAKGEITETSFKEMEKSLVLISNFILVEDICTLLCEDKYVEILTKLFDWVVKLDLTDKPKEYIQMYSLLNKYFMTVFNRIYNAYEGFPHLFEAYEGLYENINQSVIKNWENTKVLEEKKVQTDDESLSPHHAAFKEFFSSYVDLIETYVEDKGIENVDMRTLRYILGLLVEGSKFFQTDEKANNAISRILLIADKTKNEELKSTIDLLFPYLKNVVNISDNSKTLSNSLRVINNIISERKNETVKDLSNENTNPNTKEQILPILVNFMTTKPKLRSPNEKCLKILENITNSEGFLENYNKNISKNLNLIKPIISVIARHLYDSPQKKILANETNEKENVDEKLEARINETAASILERLIDPNEYKKMIKAFKDAANSFNPPGSPDNISNLETNLLNSFSLLKIKSYFNSGVTEILEILKNLLKKEISSIEAFKKDKNNETDLKNFNEVTAAASKRLNLEISILKSLNDNIITNFEQTNNEAYIAPLKDVINTIIDVFEKSSDSENLLDLLNHMQKNIDFLLSNEANLNLSSDVKKGGLINSLFNDKKFENVKFEDSIVEKVINSLMNLLRKNPESENLVNQIIKTFLMLNDKRKETPNILVKGGCPRLLLSVVENTQDIKLANKALSLIKNIAVSSEENLQLMANQNIFEKLQDAHKKFANDEEITKLSDIVTNELIKLPGQENLVSDIIKHNVIEFFDNISGGAMNSHDGKINVLNNIEKINALTSNKKQINLISDDNFLKELQDAITATISDKEISDVNEKLLQNELSLLKKINEHNKSQNSPDEHKTSLIVENVLNMIKEKSHYRDVLVSSGKLLTEQIQDDDVFNSHLKDKLDYDFIDSLFETSENYLDDDEVGKEINNILCSLCLKSNKLADYIVQKGGLNNVMEELKSLIGLNDEASRTLKYNCLNFLNSLIKDEANLKKFLAANGVNLITNLLNNEINLMKTSEKALTEDFYLTNESLKVKKEQTQLVIQDSLAKCMELINSVKSYKSDTFNDPKLVKNILKLIEANYPNIEAYQNGIALISADENKILNEEENKRATQIILSNLALDIRNDAVYSQARKIFLEKKFPFELDDAFNNLLNAKGGLSKINIQKTIQPSIKKSPTIKTSQISEIAQDANIFSTDIMNNLHRFLTYTCLANELDMSGFSKEDIQNRLYDFFSSLVDFYSYSPNISNKNFNCDEGVALALLKLSDHFSHKKGQSFKDSDENKILSIGMNFYSPQNPLYVAECLKHLNETFDPSINSNSNKEKWANYLQNVYLRSFDFLDHFASLLNLNNGVKSNIPDKVEDNFDEIISNIKSYYKLDHDADIKVSSIKQLTSSLLDLLNNPNLVNLNDSSNYRALRRVEAMFSLLKSITEKDLNNIICGSDEVVEALLNKLNQTLQDIPDLNSVASEEAKEIYTRLDDSIRDCYKLVSSKLENNMELFEKMVEHIGNDLEKNSSDSRKYNKNLEILANLAKFPILSKLLLKNKNLLNRLESMYSNTESSEVRNILSNILKPLFTNNLMAEEVAETQPELISSLSSNFINRKVASTDEKSKETMLNETDAFVNLFEEDYKRPNRLLKNEDLAKAIKLYENEDEVKTKLLALQNRINEANTAKAAEDSLNKDKESCKSLCESVKEAFEQHMKELEMSNHEGLEKSTTMKRGSTRVVTTQSNVLAKISSAPRSRMSIVAKTLFFNADNARIKSPLSSKDNCDIPPTLEAILNLVRKIYNEIKSAPDRTNKMVKEKVDLLDELLEALKSLSMSPDNHKTILEMGLINLMEKIIADPEKPMKFYIDSLDIAKNCTFSESSIPVFLDSKISTPIVEEVISLYEKPEIISSNPDLKSLFFFSNMIFSNLCRSRRGFGYLVNQIGLEKLIEIGKKTANVDILSAIVEMLVNYIQNHTKDQIAGLIKDILVVLSKCINLPARTSKLTSACLVLAGLVYSPEVMDALSRLNLIQVMHTDFDRFKEPEFLNAVLFCLGKITVNNANNSRDTLDTGLLSKLKDVTQTMMNNDIIVENITLLYKNVVKNNQENIEKFCKNGFVINTFFVLESYWDKSAPKPVNIAATMVTQARHVAEELSKNTNIVSSIVINCVTVLEHLTISDKAITYLSETKFPTMVFDVIDKKLENAEVVKICLKTLGNYLYKEVGKNFKSINLENLVKILILLQSKFFSKIEVLIQINRIAGSLLSFVKDLSDKKKLFMIILKSVQIQDSDIDLLTMALKVISDSLQKDKSLVDEVFDDSLQNILNLLKNNRDKLEVQIYCYKILTIFGTNYIYSYTMISEGLIEEVKASLDFWESKDKKSKSQIRDVVFKLLAVISGDVNNAKKISDVLVANLIKDLRDEDFDIDITSITKLIFTLTRHKSCIEPFVQFNGIDAVLKILRDYPTNLTLVYDIFGTLYSIADSSDEYKRMLITMNTTELVEDVISKSGHLDNKVKFEGGSLIFILSNTKVKVEEVEELNYVDIKTERAIKAEVENFLKSGKIVTM
jgi:hypothetical protein